MGTQGVGRPNSSVQGAEKCTLRDVRSVQIRHFMIRTLTSDPKLSRPVTTLSQHFRRRIRCKLPGVVKIGD